MKIVILNDTHRGVRNSSQVFADYQGRFYREILFPYIDRQSDPCAILHLGDYFDNRKSINVRCLNEDEEQFVRPCEERDLDVYVLVGNHDIFFRNTNRVNSLSPYFEKRDKFHVIEDPVELNIGGAQICMIPWMNKENLRDCLRLMATSSAEICAGHFEFSGFDMYRGVKAREGYNADSLAKFSMVLSGHYHTKSSRNNVHYLGAQMEFTWSDADDPKYFHVLDTNTMKLESVRNPLTIHKRVLFDDERNKYCVVSKGSKLPSDYDKYRGKFVKVVQKNVTDKHAFDLFLENMGRSDAINVSVVHPSEETTDIDDEKAPDVSDTRDMMNSYIDNMSTDLNKGHLKRIMSDIYDETMRDVDV